jgi:hypothetical protein
LEQHNVCAIWQFPEAGTDLIVAIYSRRSPGWKQFEIPPLPPTESNLHVVLLNTWPSFSLDNPTTMTVPISNVDNDACTARLPSVPAQRPQLQLNTSAYGVDKAEDDAGQQGDDNQSAASRVCSAVFSLVEAPNTPVDGDYDMPSTPSSPMALDEKQPASTPFTADFDALFCGIDRKQRKPRVFITFAKSHPLETTIIKDWLRSYIGDRYVFDNSEKGDWAEFQDHDDMSNKTSVILFHADRSAFTDLQGFYQSLRYSNVLCYNVRFTKATVDTTTADGSNPFTMLFPRGTALCITEDLLRRFPDKALFALRWFRTSSNGKAKTWKLMLFPRIQDWLKHVIRTAGDEKTEL